MNFTSFVWSWIVVAVVTFFVLLRVTAPYGRHVRSGWGPSVPHRVGWIVMELVSPAAFLAFFLAAGSAVTAPMVLFAGLWVGHYANRAIVYPLRLKTDRRMPLVIMSSAILFNSVNGAINGHFLGSHPQLYPSAWFGDPRFVVGLALFVVGLGINLHSDEILIRIKTANEGHQIPRGGLFRWVSCPHYLGELLEWIGFAILTWSLPAAAFATWTAANLLPRARAHHEWYLDRFEDYPDDRRAVIPGVF